MCGRYTLTTPDELLAQLSLAGALKDWAGTYNAAPGQELPCIVNRAEPNQRLQRMRWGLVPRWAKESRAGSKLINARAESLAVKPAFRDAYAKRRCLVPADGFYEWRRDGGSKTPFYIRRRDRKPFAFAGLWERVRVGDDQSYLSFAIATTASAGCVATIHERMPVIVAPDDYERWLCPDALEPAAQADIVAGSSSDLLESIAVSSLVNSVRNDGPELVEPAPEQLALF